MCSFEKHIALLLYIIVITKAERWYSAAIIETRDRLQNHSNSEFMPLMLIVPKKTENTQNNFASTFNTFDKGLRTDNNGPFFDSEDAIQVTNNNNIIKNIKVLRRTQPKRKYIRKKCPATNPRQAKQLSPKLKSKTRFLEVFQVVEFDHGSCTSSSGLEGTCLPEYECTDSGGSTMGTCADGYGTCCVTQFLCDDRSAAETGWFTNPDFPSPSTELLSCAFSLDKASDDIKQIRLDFNNFELLPPTDGACQDDQFIVSGQNVNNAIPIFCGINSGQHVYIEVGDVDGPIYLTFQTVASESRLFAIKVSQLTSSDELAAPPGCLQYFTEGQGYLESFNYRDKSDIVIARTPSYLNNLNYAMCIGRAAETCSVTYTNTGNMQIVNYDTDGLPVIPPGQAGVEILNCPSDWLLIAATRLCGDRLNDGSVFQDFTVNAPITDVLGYIEITGAEVTLVVSGWIRISRTFQYYGPDTDAGGAVLLIKLHLCPYCIVTFDNSAGPIVVWFRSDESYVGDGFKLMYQQNTCST